MRVLQLSVSDLSGGAARAAYRTNQALLGEGVDSSMLVQDRRSADSHVHGPSRRLSRLVSRFGRPRLDRMPLSLYPRRGEAPFHVQWMPTDTVRRTVALDPDIVHLHWVCSGFLRIEDLPRFGVPVVWTLHDMWPFTGGCHFAGDCRGFVSECGRCPQLASARTLDLSHWIWRRKHRAFERGCPTIVAPSRWIAVLARKSSLLRGARIEVIPNGLDLERFKPVDRAEARRALKLPQDTRLVAFGAVLATQDRRKGFDLLVPAMRRVAAEAKAPVELVVFGSDGSHAAPDLGMPTRYLGTVSDDASLCALYSAADVFVLPSREDNLPQTVVEALACGTPCVAFDVGGTPDLVDHGVNGYLAPAFDEASFARGVLACLEAAPGLGLREAARAKAVAEYDLRVHGARLRRLYEELLAARAGSSST